MFRRARHRLHVGLVLIACLLFQQVAVAAYACDFAPAKAPAPSGHCADSIAAPAPAKVSPLCEKHCTPDVSVLSDAATPAVPALSPPPAFSLVLGEPLAQLHEASTPITQSDPPPRLRYCSLLI
jgi:hypothetical protein